MAPPNNDFKTVNSHPQGNTIGTNITRQNTGLEVSPNSDHLNTGYEGEPSDNFTIPPCGIEDADMAVHRLFDRDIGFTVKQFQGPSRTIQISKPLVIFATGERFALAKRLKPPRDKQGKLMLPAISIRRTSVEQTSEDSSGRGINQHTGVLTIKRRLTKEDRNYQNIINRLGFKHLTNAPKTTREDIGQNKNDQDIVHGALLTPKTVGSNNNVWEIITVPQPQFFTATYEVVFWTNYTQHMNYMLETLFSSYLPQGKNHKLVTDKGYWFMATTEDIKNAQDNFDDMKDNERTVKYAITIKVKGYIFAAQGPTNAVPVRKWISAPQVSFDIASLDGNEIAGKKQIAAIQTNADKFALTDFNGEAVNEKEAQAPTTLDKIVVRKDLVDPITGKTKINYVSIQQKNKHLNGETIYKATNLETLEQLITSLE